MGKQDVPSQKQKDVDLVEDISHKRKSSRRAFTKVFKAILFETCMVKEMQKRKLRKKLCQIKSEIKSKYRKIPKPISRRSSSDLYQEGSKQKLGSPNTMKSSTPSSHYSSMPMAITTTSTNFKRLCSDNSSTSSMTNLTSADHDLQESINTKAQQKNYDNNKKIFSCYMGLCFVLISLLVLVFHGKVSAILFCSSIWVLFWPCWTCVTIRANAFFMGHSRLPHHED